MRFFYVLHLYLYSEPADKYYIEFTQFPTERPFKHNEQEDFNTFTRKFRPWKMAALFEISNDKTIALTLERYIKKQKSRKFLEKLCDENQELSGVLAQLVRVPKLRD